MRNSLCMALLLFSLSCTGNNTATSGTTEYLRCPTDAASIPGATDNGASSSDTSLFGSMSKSNDFNCVSNPTICSTLGANFSCVQSMGCCHEAIIGKCNKASDCKGNDAPVCDLSSNNCVACATANVMMGNQECVAWVAALNDPNNQALCIGGRCLECRSNMECTRPGHGFCDTKTNSCGGCTDNSQCPGSICQATQALLAPGVSIDHVGECADPLKITKVDSMATCAGADGSTTKPYCQITDAITAGKYYLSVMGRGTTMPYTAVKVDNSKTVSIVGPIGGRDLPIGQQAVINSVSVTGGASLALEEVAVIDSTGGLAAVQCNGLSTLTIQKSFVGFAVLSPNGGIYANGCTVDIEKTKIYRTQGYGISINGGSGHRVINNAILKNGLGTTEPNGMKLVNAPTGTFAFNTFAGNNQGITCDSQVAITDSIVWDTTAGSPILGSCQMSNIVTNASANGATIDPSYATTGSDPVLTDPNGTCVDKEPTSTKFMPAIIDDYFSHTRPQGNGYDIGFQELR